MGETCKRKLLGIRQKKRSVAGKTQMELPFTPGDLLWKTEERQTG
jgi:hypothetical protein